MPKYFSSKTKDITSKFLVGAVIISAEIGIMSYSIDKLFNISTLKNPRQSVVIFENREYEVIIDNEEGTRIINSDYDISSFIVDQNNDGEVDIYFQINNERRTPMEYYGKPISETIQYSPLYKGLEIPKLVQEKFDKILELEHSNFYK